MVDIMKEIHFYMDKYPYTDHNAYTTYDTTLKAIEDKEDIIHTTSLANICSDLLDDGYRIFVHRNNKVLEYKTGNMEGTNREIRKGMDPLRLFRGHAFDEYFYMDNSEYDYGHNITHNTEDYD